MALSDPMIRWAIVAKSNIQRVPFLACVNARNRRIGFHWRHPRNPLISRLILSFIPNPTCYLVMATASLPLMSNPIDSVISDVSQLFITLRAMINDKWYIISDIPPWNDSSRIWNREDYKTYALFYLVSLAKYLRRRQTRMTESNSNGGKWFSRYCENIHLA